MRENTVLGGVRSLLRGDRDGALLPPIRHGHYRAAAGAWLAFVVVVIAGLVFVAVLARLIGPSP